MPIVETCAVCGLDLHFIPGPKEGQGQYFHVFLSDKAVWYKSIHLPVPSLEDPSLQEDFAFTEKDPEKKAAFNSREKVEPRASVMPENLPSMKCLLF